VEVISDFFDIRGMTVSAHKIECVRQTWRKGYKWTGYSTVPRYADGLFFTVADIGAVCETEDGRKINVGRSDVLYIPKGSLYTMSFGGGGSDEDSYIVNFTLKDEIGNELRISDGITLFSGAATGGIISLLSSLADAMLINDGIIKRQAIFLSLLDALTAHTKRYSDVYYPIRHGVSQLIREWDKNEKIKRYADVCGISESGFYAAFKAWSGMSPAEYRNSVRINAAKSMLKNSALTVTEISQRVGFDDQYYFSRLFKKMTGVSPREYRAGK
jgi:AraC-like DNA-binding protein